MKIKNKRLHREDKSVIYSFIDYARLIKSSPLDIRLEVSARRIGEHIGINPNVTNGRLANRFASLLESGVIK